MDVIKSDLIFIVNFVIKIKRGKDDQIGNSICGTTGRHIKRDKRSNAML